MKSMAAEYRLLADETRLRALRLVAAEELNAGELTRILGLTQSAVSRQLGLLRDAGFIEERRAGRFAYFSLSEEGRSTPSVAEALTRLRIEPDDAGDLARLEDVRRERRERRMQGDASSAPAFVPGRSWAAWSRALTWLLPDGLRVLDLGCGEGALTLEIARFAASVTGVDTDAAALRRARALAKRRKVRGVRFRAADMQKLPYDDHGFDLTIVSQALHFVDSPEQALREAVRVTDGRVLVIDLLPHDQQWVMDRLGHRHLGFGPDELRRLLRRAGLSKVRVDQLPTRSDEPFRSVLAMGRTQP